jgi:Flp pilus assembly protein TadD
LDKFVLSRLLGAAGGRWSGSRVLGLRGAVAGALGLVLAGCGNDPPPQNSYVAAPKPIVTADVQPRRIVPTEVASAQDQPLAKATPKETAAMLARLGKRTAEDGNAEGAAQLYRRSLGLDPGSLPVTLALAELLYRTEDYRSAIEAYRQALRLDPVNDEAMRGMGKTLIALDRPREAVDQYRQAMVRLPRDHRVLNGLGVALDMTGDHRAAQQQYRVAMIQASGDNGLQNNLALSLALSGDYPQAIEVLTKLVSSPAATARNRQNMALVYGLMGDESRAAEIGRQDLDDDQVRRNLSYYAQLRALNDQQRSAAVFSSSGRRGEHNPTPALTPPTTPQLPAPEAPRPPPPRTSALPGAGPIELPSVGPAAGGPTGGATNAAPAVKLPPVADDPPMAAKPQAAAAPRPPADLPNAQPARRASVDKEPSSLRTFLEAVLAAPQEQEHMPRNPKMTTPATMPPGARPVEDDPPMPPFADLAK